MNSSKDYPIQLVSDKKFLTESINVLTKTSRRARSSDAEFVNYVDDKHKKWVDYYAPSRRRLYDVLEAFLDIDGGMWPQRERNELEQMDRHANSINVAKQKMETLNGSLTSEKFDFDFKPLNMDENSLVENTKHWYYADKDEFNYDTVDSETNMSGLLNSGVQGMVIDYSRRRTGTIGFKHYTDGTVLQDPYWQDNVHKNWREAMIDAYLTANQMIEQFETTDKAVQLLADSDFFIGQTYESDDNVRAWENVPRRDGSRYLVTEYRWVEKIKTTRLHACLPTGEWIALPVKITENEVRKVIKRLGIKWTDIKEFPYEDNILYYGVICPDLLGVSPDLILVRGKHPVQCGSIGLFKYSSNRMRGIDKGVFEYLLDLNRTLCYRHSKIDDVLASAAAGMTLVDKTKVGGDAGVRKIRQEKTRPDAVIGVDGNPENVAALFPVGNVPEHLFREVNNLLELMDRVSPVTPALEGAKTADESGRLLELRHEITQLGTLRLYNNWQQFLMDKAEAWYNQAQITYKGIYRKVPVADGSGSVEFNVPAFRTIGKKREKVYINSIEDLPSARVVVKLAKSSPTKRMAKRFELMEITKMLSAHPEIFKDQISILTNEFLNTIERTPEEQLKLERTQLAHEARDILEVLTQIEQLKSQGMEAKAMQMQFQEMMQNMQAKKAGPPAKEQFTPANRMIGGPNEETGTNPNSGELGQPEQNVAGV